jgi:hypothetical protein
MSEQWYCPKCGPISDGDKYMSAVMWRCGKCNALIIEGVPSHVISMQERIVELEEKLDERSETVLNMEAEIQGLKKELDLYKRQHEWECQMAAKRLNQPAGKE